MSSDKIESILQEQRRFEPSEDFVAQARINADKLDALHAEADADHLGFWAKTAREVLYWQTPFETVLDDSDAPNYRWFTDGRLNASYNCIDRHLEQNRNKTAIIFEGEQGDVRKLSFGDLHAEVCRFANGLKSRGISKGDRVVLYMPMTAEAVIAMQACARIGAIHSVVFGGFSAASLRDRIEDGGAVALITADGATRGGNIVELKAAADKALADGCKTIRDVIVLKRSGHDVNFDAERDIWWHELVAKQSAECEPEWVEAEHPLFLLYTSGSTGKPKGIQHSTGGYLTNATASSQWVFDLNERDVFWCTADVLSLIHI